MFRPVMGQPLPRASEAYIPPDKLAGYALSPEHPRGRHKARVFASALGITSSDAAYLEQAILEAVPTAPVSGIRTQGPYGYLYTVPILLEGLNGATHTVITAWIHHPAADAPPRLISAYVDIP
jgi:hypothetical protein